MHNLHSEVVSSVLVVVLVVDEVLVVDVITVVWGANVSSIKNRKEFIVKFI